MQLKIGNRVVEVEMVSGIPTIKADAEEIHYPDGHVDVVVHVPCFAIGVTEQRVGGQ
jgi:hypothetical protein